MSIDALLARPVRVVNIGLDGFARDLAANGAAVAHVDWRPPRFPFDDVVEKANAEALRRILAAEPVLVDVRRAGELIPALDAGRLLLHAGPPIEWARMCGPLRGAICGAVVFEGWAADLAAAEALAASGAVKFAPNHHFGAVGPMTGVTTRGMPLLVVENRAFGNQAFCAINEGLGKVMRFGANDAAVLARLAWLRDEFSVVLKGALTAMGGVPLNPLIARGLAMGDEMHQRNVACTSLLLRMLAPRLASSVKALEFIGANDQFFLNIAMAMGKAVMDPVSGIRGSTVVTAMSRNGTDFGVRVSGCGEQWFVAPVEMPQGLYFAGYSEADANPDMGDSTIVETIGLGGFAMAAAPAVAGFVGAGAPSSAAEFTRSMGEITVAQNPEWTIPALDFAGVPTGIDVRRVVDTGICPVINTGIAHREPGIGQVGAGVVKAPMPCFHAAVRAMAKELGVA